MLQYGGRRAGGGGARGSGTAGPRHLLDGAGFKARPSRLGRLVLQQSFIRGQNGRVAASSRRSAGSAHCWFEVEVRGHRAANERAGSVQSAGACRTSTHAYYFGATSSFGARHHHLWVCALMDQSHATFLLLPLNLLISVLSFRLLCRKYYDDFVFFFYLYMKKN